jgi:hypothetical protein
MKPEHKNKSKEKITPDMSTIEHAEKKSSLILFLSFSAAKKRTMLKGKERVLKEMIRETVTPIRDHVPYNEAPRLFVIIGI